MDTLNTKDKTVLRSLGLGGFFGGSAEGMVDIKDGRIVRVRPFHYDWKYDRESFSAAPGLSPTQIQIIDPGVVCCVNGDTPRSILWVVVVAGFIAILLLDVSTLDSQILQWRNPLLIIQAVVGLLMVAALIFWLMKEEERGLQFAIYGFLLSLVALQTLYFYLSQFSALSATLVQVVFLQILIAYRRWYLDRIPTSK